MTIDELIRGVDVALDNLSLTACSAPDRNFDGTVLIDELIEAVNAALDG